MWVWYLILYVFPYVLFQSRITIALLLYSGISFYDMVTSRAVRVIWDVFSRLLSCPCLRCYPCVSINCAQPVGETEEDDFPQSLIPFSPLRPGTTTSENFEFPLGVKESMFLLLCLPGLLSVVHTMFKMTKEIFRKAIQRSSLREDSRGGMKCGRTWASVWRISLLQWFGTSPLNNYRTLVK